MVIIYGQYQHFLSTDLGFATENILNIRVQDTKPETFSKNLEEIAAVAETSKSFMITSVGDNYYTHVKYTDLQDSLRAWHNKIDENYLVLFNFKFIAGRNFTKMNAGTTESEVIVNEALIQQLNVGGGRPENAIGEIVKVEGRDLRIVGILSNFHYSTLDRKIGPFSFETQEAISNILTSNLPAITYRQQ